MSHNDRDLDALLRQNVQRQLEGLDWDRQRQEMMQRLGASGTQKPRRIVTIRVAAGVAALLVVALGYTCVSFLRSTGPDAAAPMAATASPASSGGDSLLASTDATTILLTGPMRGRVLNDPMLTPHSSWQQ